ncbi:MAG: hypothetical protein ACXAC6_13805, partial [Candidatus Hodarchaeales archaeon]
ILNKNKVNRRDKKMSLESKKEAKMVYPEDIFEPNGNFDNKKVRKKMYETKQKTNLRSYVNKILTKKTPIFLIHAFIGWALCGAVMKIGLATTSEINALIIHALAAPVFFSVITAVYYEKFGYTTPLQTASGFIAFVILMDFFAVAPIFEQSYEMFYSLLGTWIPFFLSFVSIFLMGSSLSRKKSI